MLRRIIPGSYPLDPLAWITNQWAHTMTGQAAAFAICLGWLIVGGEFPYRLPLFLSLGLAYLIWVELWGQGWKGVDTIEDTGFFCCGAGFVLYAFREMNLGSGDFAGSIWDLAPLAIGWFTYSAGGVIGRIFNRMRHDSRQE